MLKQFLRQTPFGLFIITVSITLFLTLITLVSKNKTTLTAEFVNFAQSSPGLMVLTALPTGILILELLLRKPGQRSSNTVRHSKLTKTKVKYWTKPMGLDEPSVSFKSLAKVFNKNFSLNLRFIDNQISRRISL